MDQHLADIACGAIKYAESMQHVAYCDVRAEESNTTTVRIEDGSVDHIKNTSDSGIGIRMLTDDGVWRFVAVSGPRAIDDVREALRVRARHEIRGSDHLLGPSAYSEASYNAGPRIARITYPVQSMPDRDEITRIGLECGSAISAVSDITNHVVQPGFSQISKYYADTTGAEITHEYHDTIISMTATATGPSGTTRSVDATIGGRGGLETISKQYMPKASEIASAASELAASGTARCARNAEVVMNPGFVALLVHEILGHPSEADRIMGREMAWAGGAWWSGMLGDRIGSDALDVFDDPTLPGTLGQHAYDDEGIATSRTTLVRKGVLEGHMHSRETAAVFNAKPTGSMRAAGYGYAPLIRMACTCIGPGDYGADEIFKGVRDGYAIYDMKIPSIDMNRYNWSISCQYARRIRDGEPAEMLRDVVVSGTTPELLSSISACGRDFAVSPITNCGKGDPMQTLAMGNGGPTIRAKATVQSIGQGAVRKAHHDIGTRHDSSGHTTAGRGASRVECACA